MDVKPVSESYGITPEEISSVKEYIKRYKNTAVLTTMFTDIQGFTQMTEEMGEEYSRALRQHHDKILVDTIEADGCRAGCQVHR